MEVLTIGGATVDTILSYQEIGSIKINTNNQTKDFLIVEDGAKVEINTLKTYSGGGATNAALAFKRLGFKVNFFGKLGNDHNAKFLIKELNDYGIETKYVCFSDNLKTANSIVIPTLNKDRVVFAYRGANADLKLSDIPKKLIAKSDIIYITSLSQKSAEHLPQIVKYAKENKSKVAINPGQSQLQAGNGFIKDSLLFVDILILNYEEAKKLFSSLNTEKMAGNQDVLFSIKDFFKIIHNIGVKIAIITNGKEGVYVSKNNKIIFKKAIETRNIVNTLGAGDAFGSSFVGAFYKYNSLDKAIYYGLLNSSSVIKKQDAKSGILSLKELEQKFNKLKSI